MTPTRLRECLQSLRWPTTTLADVLSCDAGTVLAWYHEQEPIPAAVAEWLEQLVAAQQSVPLPPGWMTESDDIDLPEFGLDFGGKV